MSSRKRPGKKTGKHEEQPSAPESSGLSRRGFLIGGAITAGAGATYLLSGGRREEKADSSYLTLEEAKALYFDLKEQVTKQWERAKAANKPLRIVVLEGHTSANALAYEMMLMDIAKRLGIRDFLVEQSDHTLALMRDPMNQGKYEFEDPESGRHLELMINEATRMGMRVKGMDNNWSTAVEMAEAMRSFVAKFFAEEIQKKYQVSGFKLQIVADPEDQRLTEASYDIKGTFSPPVDLSEGSSQWHEFNEYLVTAKKRAIDAMREERNKSITQVIQNHGNSIIITGKNHGIGLLPLLRQHGDIDIAFSPADNKMQQLHLENSRVSDEQKQALRWAHDERNAIQQTGKDFNPGNLVSLVRQAIDQANSRGTRGR